MIAARRVRCAPLFFSKFWPHSAFVVALQPFCSDTEVSCSDHDPVRPSRARARALCCDISCAPDRTDRRVGDLGAELVALAAPPNAAGRRLCARHARGLSLRDRRFTADWRPQIAPRRRMTVDEALLHAFILQVGGVLVRWLARVHTSPRRRTRRRQILARTAIVPSSTGARPVALRSIGPRVTTRFVAGHHRATRRAQR